MKAVVTGGAGYIGSNVTALLLEAGHEVIVLDNLSEGNETNVPSGAQFIRGSIADFSSLFSVSDNIEVVIHLAAFIAAGESMLKPEKYWQNNLVGSLKLLEAMRDIGIRKLIFSSTAAVYGNPETMPIEEDAAQNPTNTYGMTKLAVDMAISSECAAYELAATSLRYFNVAGAYKNYGERHSSETHIIPLALMAAKSNSEFIIYGDDYPTPDGTCIRDYIHVRDLARAHLLALDKLQPSKHAIYNLGNGNGFSNRKVIQIVEKVTAKTMQIKIGSRREGDPASLVASSKLAYEELGWQPEKPELETMVKDAWQFYQSIQP
jgi:UDP-glucose 4-epimerase